MKKQENKYPERVKHIAKKRFGQHFLHDPNIINQIVSKIAPNPDDRIIEIGPGLGALTKIILPKVKHLDVIEIDRDVIPKLQEICGFSEKLHIHQADVLTVDLTRIAENNIPLRVIGNLPYNISTPIIFHLIKQIAVIKDMHFMLQKEVVERMAASVGSSAYGRLSIMVQYHCQVEQLFAVSRGAFVPSPKVESAIVRLIPYKQLPFIAQDYKIFENVVRFAFNQRRKAIRNSLKHLLSIKQLEELHVDPNLRPEQISLELFVKMSNQLVNFRD